MVYTCGFLIQWLVGKWIKINAVNRIQITTIFAVLYFRTSGCFGDASPATKRKTANAKNVIVLKIVEC